MGISANNARWLLKYAKLNPSTIKLKKTELAPDANQDGLKLNKEINENRNPGLLFNDLDLSANINKAMHSFDDK